MAPDRHRHVARVAEFMAEHTKSVTDIGGDQQCPVCLDEYDSRKRRPLQIKDAEGCRHVLCKTCLKKLLRKHPNENKRCPFCRAVWIAVAHLPASRQYVTRAEYQAKVAQLQQRVSGLMARVKDERAEQTKRMQQLISRSQSVETHNVRLQNALHKAYESDKRSVNMLIRELKNPIEDVKGREEALIVARRLRQNREKISENWKKMSENEKKMSENEKKISENEKKISENERKISENEKKLREISLLTSSETNMRANEASDVVGDGEQRGEAVTEALPLQH